MAQFCHEHGVNAEQLTAMVHLSDCPITNQECRNNVLLHYLTLHWDTTVPIYDSAFADETSKIEPGLHCLMKAVRLTDNSARIGRNLIVVVSELAAFIAHQISEDYTVSVSMDGVTLNAKPDDIHMMTKMLESQIISTILSHQAETIEFFEQENRRICELIANEYCQNEPFLTLMKILAITARYLKNYLQIDLVSFDELKQLLHDIKLQSNLVLNADQEIIRDFTVCLSERLRTGEFAAVQKKHHMRIDRNEKIVIIDGSRLYISGEMLDDVLQTMQTTHNRRGLLNALRHSELLNTTDGDTHPIQTHDSSGASLRLYWYDIDAEILDADVLHRLTNLDSAPFWMRADELSNRDFVSLLHDESGHVAGRLIRYSDEANSHFYITGQSGFGKTHLLCQLMAKHHALGHQIVVFDSSDSFAYEAMCRNLSQTYVERCITFHDIDRNGIPIDLFCIDRSASLPSQKKELLGILTAGTGELTASQSNTLRSVLSDMLSVIGKDELIRTEDILAMLEEEGTTYGSIRNRLIPLFEDMDACGMSKKSWGDYLQEAGKIVVIHTESDFTEKGCQIIDMLLTALFNYQRGNPGVPLDIFIDEVQNQNFSAISPIRKILKEGRKFHMSFFGATQDYYPRNTELGSVMGKAGTQFFLRPTQNSEGIAASELRFGKADMARFDSMQRGDVIVKGSFYNREHGRNTPVTLTGCVDSFIKQEVTEQ